MDSRMAEAHDPRHAQRGWVARKAAWPDGRIHEGRERGAHVFRSQLNHDGLFLSQAAGTCGGEIVSIRRQQLLSRETE